MKTIEFAVAFEDGDFVYIKTDENQIKRQISSIEWHSNMIHPLYTVNQGDTISKHFDFELSLSQDLETKLGID